MADQPTTNNNNAGQTSQSYQDLVQQIADKVWAMWQKELRIDRERKGQR